MLGSSGCSGLLATMARGHAKLVEKRNEFIDTKLGGDNGLQEWDRKHPRSTVKEWVGSLPNTEIWELYPPTWSCPNPTRVGPMGEVRW